MERAPLNYKNCKVEKSDLLKTTEDIAPQFRMVGAGPKLGPWGGGGGGGLGGAGHKRAPSPPPPPPHFYHPPRTNVCKF